jgi:hypothetical protein
MTTDYDKEINRDKAEKRAKKMEKLLKAPHFAEIMNTVDPNPDKKAFRAACGKAGLVSEEIEWLWTYLKQCTKAVYEPIKDAAATGW